MRGTARGIVIPCVVEGTTCMTFRLVELASGIQLADESVRKHVFGNGSNGRLSHVTLDNIYQDEFVC
jgi:hypothetical protein